jgi:subtilase family serine protease
VNGEDHWANSSDPQIPTALAPIVAGIATLHNFLKKPQIVLSGARVEALYKAGARPQVTFPSGVHALGPADFAAIYNVAPLYNNSIDGTGTIISVVGRSNINLQDVFDFRSVFGLSGPAPEVSINGSDPGNLGGDEEAEAVLDTTWSGAMAPGARVGLVVSASTNTTDGVELSEFYIIDNFDGNVMSESFGGCEADVTSSEASRSVARTTGSGRRNHLRRIERRQRRDRLRQQIRILGDRPYLGQRACILTLYRCGRWYPV